MKRSISLWLGMTAVAGFLDWLLHRPTHSNPPAAAAEPPARFTGASLIRPATPGGGNVSLSTDGGET